MSNEEAYRAMSDYQLEDIAINRRIKPRRIVDANGERYGYDREYIIDALLRSEAIAEPNRQPAVSNYIHVGTMNNSSLMQGSPSASLTQSFVTEGTDLKDLVTKLAEVMGRIDLTESARAQVDSDLATLRAQAGESRFLSENTSLAG